MDSAFAARAGRHLLHYGCDFADFVPVRASGCWLYDGAGNKMLDFTSGQMSSILGHAHPEIHATIKQASGTLDHLFSAMISEPVVALAEKLSAQEPELSKAMFLSTGGEANEAAIKLAKTVTGKWEIVTFTKSYHGVTAGSAAATFKVGRTGTMFAFQRDGVVPDILTLSKTLGAGMALSAVMTNDRVAALADEKKYFFYTTHVNDPLPAAVGLKVLEIVLRDKLVDRAREAGERLGAGLLRLKQRHGCIGDVRGRGLLRGLEFTSVGSRDASSISNAVTEASLEVGLAANIVRSGTAGGTMRIAPPLIVKDEELDEGLALLDTAIARVVGG